MKKVNMARLVAVFTILSIAAGFSAMYFGLEDPNSAQTFFLAFVCFCSLVIAFIGLDYLISKTK